MATLSVAVGPRPSTFASDAIIAGGGRPADPDGPADALVWVSPSDMDGLAAALAARPELRWVQLPYAGVEPVVEAGLLDNRRVWTCAKGAYAEPVAEHALALALAGLRGFKGRMAARTWGSPAGTSLFDERVAIVGGGGIARALLELLAPFRVEATVVRRAADPVPGAAHTVGPDRLHHALDGALVVFVALALSPQTTGIIDAAAMAAMDPRAWLVNVARGRHVVTDALVDALASGTIAGAALDVTDPEPLPDGHPLWTMENCIVTPHTADTPEMVLPLLAARIRTNVQRWLAGLPLVGIVDPVAGY